jgi:nicotinamide phosphoribosyltransferase
MQHNIILNSDSYKYSMPFQYPAGTEYVYSYIESRGGPWPETVFFGLQAFIKEYLLRPVTMADIDEAEAIITAHGEPFYREGWERIVRVHGGRLPARIRAVPEGTRVPVKNVLATIENTDPQCWWLTTFLETALLRAVWYPSTVATNSWESRRLILAALEKTGDPGLIDFKLHDFGARGVSSQESAGLGGAAHLIGFRGTDTVSALLAARRYYGADMAGFSIPAAEHSTITSWGRDNEVKAYRNMIQQFGHPGALVAVVSDSYDIFAACEKWGTELRDDVIQSGATLVVRPDSGNPAEVVVRCLRILDQNFGHTVNAKGYRVLNNVRVIQGDGIDHGSIHSILFSMDLAGYSADNVAFGQGGALLQRVDRDTMRWAMKCSAVCVDGEWREVYKDPVTDSGKTSKRGRVTLYRGRDGSYWSGVEDWEQLALITVFENGVLMNEITFEQVRANSRR